MIAITMNDNVSIAAALIGGILSFLSPCVLPLVPPYLVYLAGTSAGRLAAAGEKNRILPHTVLSAALFVAGLSTVFVALGAGASAIGGLFRQHLDQLAIGAGIVIIVMGLHFLGLTRLGLLMRQARLDVGRPAGLSGAYVMGCAFAFGWTPCIGPVLAAILTMAGAQATAAKGAGLLAVYSFGLGLPFIAAALLAEPFAVFMLRFRRHMSGVERVMGRPARSRRHRFPRRRHAAGEFLVDGGFSSPGPGGITVAGPVGPSREGHVMLKLLVGLGLLAVVAVFAPSAHAENMTCNSAIIRATLSSLSFIRSRAQMFGRVTGKSITSRRTDRSIPIRSAVSPANTFAMAPGWAADQTCIGAPADRPGRAAPIAAITAPPA